MIVWLEYSLSIEGRYGYETSGELFVGWYKFKQGPNALEIPKLCKLWFETLKIWAKKKKKSQIWYYVGSIFHKTARGKYDTMQIKLQQIKF